MSSANVKIVWFLFVAVESGDYIMDINLLTKALPRKYKLPRDATLGYFNSLGTIIC